MSTAKRGFSFICVGGSDKYLDQLSDSAGTNYVGPLACGLVEREAEDIEESLLSEDGSAYWVFARTDSPFPRINGFMRQVSTVWRTTSFSIERL
jgi:hypothetical protein